MKTGFIDILNGKVVVNATEKPKLDDGYTERFPRLEELAFGYDLKQYEDSCLEVENVDDGYFYFCNDGVWHNRSKKVILNQQVEYEPTTDKKCIVTKIL